MAAMSEQQAGAGWLSDGASRPRSIDADVDLLHGVRRRDEDALAALYDQYGGLVFTLAFRLVGDRDLAEEVMQDVFLRCWHGIEQFDAARGPFAAWLMGVTRNRAIDVLRGRQHQARLRESASLPSESADEPHAHDEADAIAARQSIQSALVELSQPQREAIQLAYFRGLSQAEVADHLGQPLGTVKTRIRDGLRRLRGLLASVYDREIAGEETR